MDKKYIVTRMKDRIFSFLLHDSKAVEIHCDELSGDTVLGNIYIGKIKNIVKNIEAAFVEISPGAVCYLPLSDLKHPVYTKKGTSRLPQAGDELLVQVLREGIKTKAPAVTTNLTLHGKYLLLTTGNRNLSVSSKLSKEEKERLLAIMRGQEQEASDQRIQETERPYGWLIRTNAAQVEEARLEDEREHLRLWYERLMECAFYRTCFTCLYRTPAAYLSRLSNLYAGEADEILTDDPVLYEEIRSYLTENQPEDTEKLSYYEDALLPLSKLYSLEHQLSQALSEKVWLKSGGYLVIQPTEALTVVDVNTGKCETGKKKEATFLKINQEAAIELARQLRLRNISGIILVDFINMEQEASSQVLLSLLAKELHKDPIRTALIDMTKLSLVEITRMKKEKSLAEVCRMLSTQQL